MRGWGAARCSPALPNPPSGKPPGSGWEESCLSNTLLTPLQDWTCAQAEDRLWAVPQKDQPHAPYPKVLPKATCTHGWRRTCASLSCTGLELHTQHHTGAPWHACGWRGGGCGGGVLLHQAEPSWASLELPGRAPSQAADSFPEAGLLEEGRVPSSYSSTQHASFLSKDQLGPQRATQLLKPLPKAVCMLLSLSLKDSALPWT